MFFPEDIPRRGGLLPRALAEHIMAQVEDPASLGRWDNPAYQLITLILIRCGLRISDATGLPPAASAYDGDGAPYLRYYNQKMKREALVPIDEELDSLISATAAAQPRTLARRDPGPVPAAQRQHRRAPAHHRRHLPATPSAAGWPPATSATSTASLSA